MLWCRLSARSVTTARVCPRLSGSLYWLPYVVLSPSATPPISAWDSLWRWVVTRAALKAIPDRLRTVNGAERVLVYGSVACGEPTKHSDIAILVIAPTTERFYARMGSVLPIVRDISHGIPPGLTPSAGAAQLTAMLTESGSSYSKGWRSI